MKKLFLVLLLSALFLGCKEVPQNPPEPRPEHETPLRLNPEEAEYWKRLMLVNYKKPGMYHPDRAALLADRVIIELRLRTGDSKNVYK